MAPDDPGVPFGATFMRSTGEQAYVDATLKRIADGILRSGVLVSLKPGQRIIDAVWNAKQTLNVLAWAEMEVRDDRALGDALQHVRLALTARDLGEDAECFTILELLIERLVAAGARDPMEDA